MNKITWSADQQLVEAIFGNLEKARYARTILKNVHLALIYYGFSYNTIKSQLKRNDSTKNSIENFENLLKESKELARIPNTRNHFMKEKTKIKNYSQLSEKLDEIDSLVNDAIFEADLGFRQDFSLHGLKKIQSKYGMESDGA